jgi:lysophospholipid acyltransferase (LPLAT)-like uncharacterized protein
MIERLLPLLATLLAKTLRIKWSGEPIPPRAVLMFWHGKMIAGWYGVRKRNPIALVSQSKDGRLLAAVLAKWGFKLTRGSSKKSGMEALGVAMHAIESREADTLAITPDGPRGPRHKFKRGAFIAARELSLPLYILRIEYSSRMVLNSWDKFEVPFPFTSVKIEATQIDVKTFPQSDKDEQQAWLDNLSLEFDDAAH